MSFLMQPYAFRDGGCTMTRADGKVTFAGSCIYCRRPQTIEVDEDAAGRYQRGEFVQDCFPTLSPGDREFLISGICDTCWNEMFGPAAEDAHQPPWPHGDEESDA